MNNIFKALILQILWFMIAWLGPKGFGSFLIPISFLIVWADIKIYRPQISTTTYFCFALVFALIGAGFDSLLYAFQLVQFIPNGLSFWQLSMWIIFITYYDKLFRPFKDRPIMAFIMGFVGGPLAYVGVEKMGGIEINGPIASMVIIGIFWGLFLVYSLKYYYAHTVK